MGIIGSTRVQRVSAITGDPAATKAYVLGLSPTDVDMLVSEALGVQQLTSAAAESARLLNYEQFKEAVARDARLL